jgi:hypothetical protein
LASSSPHALHRLIGMVRSPRATLAGAVRDPRSLDLGVLIIVISAACSAGFLMTRVGQLAALDQQVRQLESFGVVITDDTYEQLRGVVPYRPVASAALIVIGWPILWLLTARVLQWFGNRTAHGLPRRPVHPGAEREVGSGERPARGLATFAQVLTVVVHASAIFALGALIATPVNYVRESLGSVSLGSLMPAFGESTFPARLLSAVDLFVVWWLVLIALGLSILYRTRTLPIARWLFGAYAGGAAALALTQALRGGV